MPLHRCPREEEKFLKPQGIFEVECSGCGQAVEFFEDDQKRKCGTCGAILVNPRRRAVE